MAPINARFDTSAIIDLGLGPSTSTAIRNAKSALDIFLCTIIGLIALCVFTLITMGLVWAIRVLHRQRHAIPKVAYCGAAEDAHNCAYVANDCTKKDPEDGKTHDATGFTDYNRPFSSIQLSNISHRLSQNVVMYRPSSNERPGALYPENAIRWKTTPLSKRKSDHCHYYGADSRPTSRLLSSGGPRIALPVRAHTVTMRSSATIAELGKIPPAICDPPNFSRKFALTPIHFSHGRAVVSSEGHERAWMANP